MSAPYVDQEILKSIMTYSPETGVFVWKNRPDYSQRWNSRYSGKVAGYDWKCKPNLSYRSIRIFDWPFLGHRLAYLYMVGSWPDLPIDHKDLDGLNNAWSNLRLATKSQNSANTLISSKNTSGFKGVSQAGHSIKYRATIRIDGRQKWLGAFETKEEAAAAYNAAALEKSGEYARSL